MSTPKAEPVPIPGPRGVPLMGNILDIESEIPLRSLEMMADTYGPIYRLTTFGFSRCMISSHELAAEVFDEERFTKKIMAGLSELRHGIHDGLFTAHMGEENWEIAHRVLMPAFGPLNIQNMFDEMHDIATQLVMKWARQGPKQKIMVTDDFTRLTLDTIALCAMGTRFNSFYSEEMHPFVDAMVGMLKTAGDRSRRPGLVNNLPTTENNKYWEDIDYLRNLCKELVDTRKKNPTDKKDLLNALINGRDPKTGKGMSYDSIIDNMITFLIAGHETTSGLLSFAFYNMLKNPQAYQKAQEEVDRVIGRRRITVEDLQKLPYITAVMRETLRLTPTAPAIAVGPHPTKNHEDPVTLGNGKYVLGKDEPCALLLGKIQRDPKVYGPDAEEFKPERMLDEHFNKLPKHAWKPFGNGMRACIGRPFAWQEALLVIAMLLQNFNFQMDDPSYNIQLKQTLTIKPNHFYMRAALREGLDAVHLGSALSASSSEHADHAAGHGKAGAAKKGADLKPMHVYYGSNTGTCEAFARRLADDATSYGYSAEVESLDSAKDSIPKNGPVVFITASYEGQPPDNAAHFFEWLSALKGDKPLDGVNYAVFGCGHHDWQTTFYRIPKEVNRLVGENGANRLCEIGLADTANADIVTDFDTWGETSFWPAVAAKFGSNTQGSQKSSTFRVEVSSGHRATTLGLQLQEGLVVENTLLTQAGVPAKRTIRFKLPTDTQYKCGDYLAILPVNPSTVVRKVMSRFDLPWDAVLRIEKASPSSSKHISIPMDTQVSAYDLFATYVELSQPASKRDLAVLADAAAVDPETQAELQAIASDPARFAEISQKRISVLDLLLQYPSINLAIGDFVAMLPPMRVRQYSISSSPLVDPTECSITFSVLKAPSLAALTKEDEYLGVASTYLSELRSGERVQLSVRPSHTGFKPPTELSTPMIMACAGSGLAPFRGFVMDRAEKIRGRRSSGSMPEQPAKAILYAGCRTQGKDDIHADELAEWEKIGAVEVRRAYSRPSDGSKGTHVQDLMMEDKKELIDLFESGARIYVCGTPGVGNAVRDSIKSMFLERREEIRRIAKEKGEPVSDDDEETAFEKFLDDMKTKERYTTDVFA
ncbi:cytochrome P450 [Aspergillus oryzae 100-8]|uniref:Bifunctional cytochrome P450/NADPH--P450 reductase n=1 Tax=Aspergillus oryzae (strain 3.042) TaxID=1160506 RepID=I8TGK6_ASPO3|nr:cytochrome protein [Aspergillus oryzae 3.042]KDE82178.1 cytochrome P450 [Aspergillus oryzae 100-8]|eukprot:EIT73160.1 cytochrome protein [Aspergillus oryzae 3.042]